MFVIYKIKIKSIRSNSLASLSSEMQKHVLRKMSLKAKTHEWFLEKGQTCAALLFVVPSNSDVSMMMMAPQGEKRMKEIDKKKEGREPMMVTTFTHFIEIKMNVTIVANERMRIFNISANPLSGRSPRKCEFAFYGIHLYYEKGSKRD